MTLARNRRKRKSKNKSSNNVKIKKAMKRLILVLESKGGAGKSVLFYNIANILQRSNVAGYYFDMDNESKSSLAQCKFVDVHPFDLINDATKNIDRSKLNSFLDNYADNDKAEVAVCDFGAASSEQFLKYAESKEGRAVLASFEGEIQIEIYCVVSGGNDYPSCGDYCQDLFNATKGIAKLFIAKNNQRPYSKAQLEDIARMHKQYSANLIPFNITMENGDSDVTQIKAQMFKGLSSYDIKARSTRLVYNLMLDEMNFQLEN